MPAEPDLLFLRRDILQVINHYGRPQKLGILASAMISFHLEIIKFP